MQTSSNIKPKVPVRGEVWYINFDPTIGAEIKKTRPAVVVSSDALRSLPLRLVAPITEWKDLFSGKLSHVKILPNKLNGLAKPSAVDTLQLRGVALERFVSKCGQVSADEIAEVAAAIAMVVEYE